MVAEITQLSSPIDVMYLVHKSLRAEADRVEHAAEQIEMFGTLQPFKTAFYAWASALCYLSEKEDALISKRLVRGNHNNSDTNSPVPSPGTGESFTHKVRRIMATNNEDEHQELNDRLEDVLTVLNEEIGRTSVIHRTKQHLSGRVLDLHIAQDDHLENEGTFVIPLVREQLTDAEQLATVRSILLDEASSDPHWVLDWMAQWLTPGERRLLADLESRFDEVAPKPV